MKIAYTMTPTSVNVIVDNRMRTINDTHVNWRSVVGALRHPESFSIEDFKSLIDIPAFIAKMSFGAVQINDTTVLYKNEEMKGVLVKRMLAMMADGFDITPLMKFMHKLQENPLESAREELYLWLETSNLPITPDGNFLAFKKVDDDYNSFHNLPDGSKLSNKIGNRVSMPREKVDTNRRNTCSVGLHFCSYDYLSFYDGSSGHVVICEIDPADVVAIPHDYNNQKGRTWNYLVVGEVPQDEADQFLSGMHVAYTFHSEGMDASVNPEEDSDDPLGYDYECDDDDDDEYDCDYHCNGDYDDDYIEDEGGGFDSHGTYVGDDEDNSCPTKESSKNLPRKSDEHLSKVSSELFTTNTGRSFRAKGLLDFIDGIGSKRAFAREFNMAESTVRGWVKRAMVEVY